MGLLDTEKVWNSLVGNHNLDDFLKDPEAPFPAPSSLLSDKSEHEVIEIRNHLLATYFLYNTLYGLAHEIDLDHIRRLHHMILRDLPTEKVESDDGTFHDAGDFRKV